MASNVQFAVLLLGLMEWFSIGETGRFWQVTDIHVDANYSLNGDVAKMCHGNTSKESIGYYGNYNCDAPWVLVKSAVENMKLIEPNPDFILWTGDSIAHVDKLELNLTKIYQTINRLKVLLQDQFPNTTIIPVIGNHDSYPANEFPYENTKAFYQGYLTKAGFEDFIPPSETSFLKGGYYSKDISPGFKVIVLNTNLYLSYRTNETSTVHSTQLIWLKQELKMAQEQNKTVLITAHVPPGYFERIAIIPFLLPQYNDVLVELFLNYSNVILTQIYGHTHTDAFRLFFSPKRYLKSHAFIAPSVTPWKIAFSGLHGINPSIRLYDYDLSSRMITDYHQYYLNLSQANENALDDSSSAVDNSRGNKIASWNLLYQATDYYKTQNLSTNALGIIYRDIATKPTVFDKYFKMNSAGVESDMCDKSCRNMHICAMAQLTVGDMTNCLKKIGTKTLQLYNIDTVTSVSDEKDATTAIPGLNLQEASPTYTPYILAMSIGMLAVLVLVVIFFLRKRHLHSGPRYFRHFAHAS